MNCDYIRSDEWRSISRNLFFLGRTLPTQPEPEWQEMGHSPRDGATQPVDTEEGLSPWTDDGWKKCRSAVYVLLSDSQLETSRAQIKRRVYSPKIGGLFLLTLWVTDLVTSLSIPPWALSRIELVALAWSKFGQILASYESSIPLNWGGLFAALWSPSWIHCIVLSVSVIRTGSPVRSFLVVSPARNQYHHTRVPAAYQVSSIVQESSFTWQYEVYLRDFGQMRSPIDECSKERK